MNKKQGNELIASFMGFIPKEFEERATNGLRVDYMTVDYEGTTYLMRA